MPNPPRAIVFDLFHTLVSMGAARTPGRATWEIVGIDQEAWLRQVHEFDDLLVLGRATDPLAAFTRMIHNVDATVPSDRIAQAFAERCRRFAYTVEHVDPETLAVLDRLRDAGLRLALCSNAWHEEIAAWDRSPLASRLDVTVFSCHAGVRKPDPAIYEHVCHALQLSPAQCWFVGDGGSDELRGARRAGLVPVLITHHLDLQDPHKVAERRPLATQVITHLNELLPLVGHPQPEVH